MRRVLRKSTLVKEEPDFSMQKTAATVHFSDPKDRQRVKRAAKLTGQTFSALVSQAAIDAANKIIVEQGGPCPTCGHKHASKTRKPDKPEAAAA